MTALLLFALLVVLLIATGLMPGILRAIGGILALAALFAIFAMVGPAYGFGGIALIVVAWTALYIWEEHKIRKMHEPLKIPERD